MDALGLSPLLTIAAGPAAALGLAHAVSILRPVARSVDVRKPVVVAVSALWAGLAPAALIALSNPSWLAPAVVFAWGGLAIALMDLAALRAPHAASAVFALAGLGFAIVWAPERAPAAALAAGGAFLLLHAARLAFRKARGRDGLGGGDPGVMAALAAWLGPAAAPWALALGGGIALAAVFARGKQESRIPLAACLAIASLPAAAVSALLWGSPFWAIGGP